MKRKVKLMANISNNLVAIFKCLPRTLKILGNVYVMFRESSRPMYGVEMWGLQERSKETDKTRGRFCRKILRMPRLQQSGWLN